MCVGRRHSGIEWHLEPGGALTKLTQSQMSPVGLSEHSID